MSVAKTARQMLSVEKPPPDPQITDERASSDKLALQPEVSNLCQQSTFSIRDYVFSARSKDIETNWPFSQRNLQLCLKHGLKDVLPPFQALDPVRNHQSRCGVEHDFVNHNSSTGTSLVKLEGKPGLSDLHHQVVVGSSNNTRPQEAKGAQWNQKLEAAGGCSGSDSPITRSATPTARSKARLPQGLLEVEASSSCQTQPPSAKKYRLVVKLGAASGHPSGSTSTALAPEPMASKTCPVCKTFFSSSNTTLNAHIDQCLSPESTSKWEVNLKLTKHKIKPRKMRLMVDICATAPRCTLEDLDRRNGSNWAALNSSLPQPVRVGDSGDEGSVYVDANGTKLRILSKMNDSSSSLPKVKGSKFISANQKKAKHQKYLKLSPCPRRASTPSTSNFETHQVPPGNNEVEVGCLLRSHQTIEEIRQSDAETIRQWPCSRRSNLLRKITSDHVHQTAEYNSCATYAGMSDPIQTAPNPLSNPSPSDPSYGGVGKKIGRKRACSPSLGARLTGSVKRSEKQNVNSLSSPLPDNPETRSTSLFASRKVKDSCLAFSSSVRCPFVPEARKLQLSIKKCSVPKLKKSRLHLIADRGEGTRELQPGVNKKRHSGNESRNHEQKKGRRKLDGINNFFESEAEAITEIAQGRTARARCVSQREETIGLQFASHFYGSGRNDASGSGNVDRTSNFAGLEPAPTEDVAAHEARVGLLGAQALLGPTETCSSADEVCATDVIKLKGVDCSKGQHISFECEVDPIPIPGPPGSFLPSPGEEDMDSEGDVLGSSSSLTGSLVHSPPDFHRSGADRDSSDSPVSAISVVSADLKYSHPGLPIGEVPHVVQDNHCWSSFSDGDRVKPTADNATTAAQTASMLVERTSSDEKSSKKREALDTIFEDYNHQSFHQARSEGASVGGSIYDRELFCFSSCPSLVPDRNMIPLSASTSASNNNPVLRLMGKNLMVVNKDGDESFQIRDEHLGIANNCSRPQFHLFNKECRSFQHEVPSQSRGCEILEQYDAWPQSDRPQVGPSNAASPPSQIRDENSAENQPVIIIDNETADEGTRRVFTIPTALGNYNARLHYNPSSIYYPSRNALTHTASFRSPPSGVLQVRRNTSMASSPPSSSHLRSASYYFPRLS